MVKQHERINLVINYAKDHPFFTSTNTALLLHIDNSYASTFLKKMVDMGILEVTAGGGALGYRYSLKKTSIDVESEAERKLREEREKRAIRENKEKQEAR